MLDYFPNADHAGHLRRAGGGRVRRAPGSTSKIETPPDPSAPLKLLQRRPGRRRRSPTSPSCCSRATRARDLVARRRARPEAADVADVARRARASRARSDLAGKRVGTAGHPVPVRLPEDDPRQGGRRPRRRSRRPTSASTSCRRCSPRRSTRRSARSGTTRASTSRRRGRKPTILRMEKLGVPTYNELILVARRKDLDEVGASQAAALPAAPPRAGHRLLRGDPAVGVDALLKVDTGLDRGLQTDVVQATLPVFFPADTEQAVRLAGPERVGGLRAAGCAQNKLLKRPPDARGAADQRVPAGRGAATGSSGARDAARAPAARTGARRPAPSTRRSARRTRAPRPRRRAPAGCRWSAARRA